MRFARLSSLLVILLAAVLAGCGGNQIAADEVPVDPPVLTIPSDAEAAPGATTADRDDADDDEEDADADASPTADPGTGAGGTTSSGTTADPGTTGGTTDTDPATGGAEPTASPTAAPTEDAGGASADEGLDQFCADNPGAC